MPDASFYNRLYRLQDDALKVLSGLTDFYLTGGTAISRFYYGHRYSDDLDLFLNYSQDFRTASRLVIATLKENFASCRVTMDTETFIRMFVSDEDEVLLKIEMVHDVEFHYDGFVSNDLYHLIDNPRNILSNKLCALSRNAPKDVADIIAICEHEQFTWPELFEEAEKKDTWANVLSAVNVINNMDMQALLSAVEWKVRPDPVGLKNSMEIICRDIVNAGHNTLYSTTH